MTASRTAPARAPKRGAPLTPKALVRALRRTIADQAVDVDAVLERRGQLAAVELRRQGRPFSPREHLRALILAWLTGRRPWARIGEQLEEIERIFRGYDPRKLERLDAERASERLCELACGNRGIHAQLGALPWNLKQLKRIEREFGSLDDFVESDEPLAIAKLLSRPSSPHKLEQVGLPIALDYLRSVGVDLAKPTALVRRALGPERLGLSDGDAKRDAFAAVQRLAEAARISATEVDSLFWLLCAPDQADVCGGEPRCEDCRLSASCAEGLRRAGTARAR
ncbi:MAG: hypothetical protein KDC14_06535 [Planctomycetes bacterium]|nr:hypothetical protein [Planctomycetota bacterium]